VRLRFKCKIVTKLATHNDDHTRNTAVGLVVMVVVVG